MADTILSIYTHPRPLVRRIAFVVLVGSQLLIVWLLFRTTSRSAQRAPSKSLFRRTKQTVVSNPDPNASLYRAVAPTAEQNVEYTRLKTLIDSRQSSYDPAAFEPHGSSAHSNRRLEGVAVTAVILHWKRKRGLDLILHQLSRYPYIREIIVWNNRGIDLVHAVSSAMVL